MLAQPNRRCVHSLPVCLHRPQTVLFSNAETCCPAALVLPAAEAGVTRQMLESLDRPVRCEPEW